MARFDLLTRMAWKIEERHEADHYVMEMTPRWPMVFFWYVWQRIRGAL
jgi:hypothetical protein